jgi:hypothetical protein
MFLEFITGSPYESLRKSGTSIRKKKKKNPALLTPSTASAARLASVSQVQKMVWTTVLALQNHAVITPPSDHRSTATGAIFSGNSYSNVADTDMLSTYVLREPSSSTGSIICVLCPVQNPQ